MREGSGWELMLRLRWRFLFFAKGELDLHEERELDLIFDFLVEGIIQSDSPRAASIAAAGTTSTPSFVAFPFWRTA